MRTVASAKGKGSRGRPCPCPAVPHTTHAHARAPSVPGSGKVRDSKTATLYTNRASPRPKQQLANAPSRPALLSRAPPLMASRNVTTPTSTPLGRNPAPLSSQPLWPLPRRQRKPHLPAVQWALSATPSSRRSRNVFRVWVGLGLFAAPREVRLLVLIPRDPSGRPPLPFSPAITWNSGVPNPEVKAGMQLRGNGESDRAGSRREEKKGRTEGVRGFQGRGSPSQGTWRSAFVL